MRRVVGGMAVLAMVAAPAAAQNVSDPGRFYIGGVVGAHAESADFVDGRTTAVGIVGGARLTRSWGIEVEAGRPVGSFRREDVAIGISFPPSGTTPVTPQDFERYGVLQRFIRERTVVSTLSVGAVYQPRVHPRWQPRLFMGVFNNRMRDRFATEVLRLPSEVDPARLASIGPTDERSTRNVGGFSVGGGVGFALTRHLTIAPEVRYDYGSIGDEINNALRTSVRTTWSF
jgi:opacity protein-like surface antigen